MSVREAKGRLLAREYMADREFMTVFVADEREGYILLSLFADDAGYLTWDLAEIAGTMYRFEPTLARETKLAGIVAHLAATGRFVDLGCGHAHMPKVEQRPRGRAREYAVREVHSKCTPASALEELSSSALAERESALDHQSSPDHSRPDQDHRAPAREAAPTGEDEYVLRADDRHPPVMVKETDVENGVGSDGVQLDAFRVCLDCFEPIVGAPGIVVVDDGSGGLARLHPTCRTGIAVLERRRDEPDFAIEDPEHAVLTWLARAGAHVEPNGRRLHRDVIQLVRGHPGSVAIATMASLQAAGLARTAGQFVYGASNQLDPIPASRNGHSKNGTSKAGHTRSVEEIDAAFNRPPKEEGKE